MEAIYDDTIHVLNACHMLATQPSYRPLVYWITCQTGESLTLTSWLSFVCLAVSAVFLLRVMRPDDNNPPSSAARPWVLALLFLHPIYLFPYFYPAQFSNALTILWAAGAFWVLDRNWKNRWLPLVFLPLAFVGNLVRVEAIVFLLFVTGAVYVFRGPVSGAWNPLRVFGKARTIRIAAFVGTYLVLTQILTRTLFTGTAWMMNESPAVTIGGMITQAPDPNYPSQSHWPVQMYAQLLYLKNLLFPAGFSFFGPWNHWYYITEEAGLRIAAFAAFLAVVGGLVALAIRAKVGSPRRALCFGLLVFLGVALASSVARRYDWYAVSREVLATGLFIPFAAAAILAIPVERRRRFVVTLASIYVVFSVAIVGLVKYRDLDRFLHDEANKVGKYSPYVNYERMRRFESQGNIQAALDSAYRAYHAVPPDSIRYSRSARLFRESALAKNYELAQDLGDEKTSRRAAEALMKSDSYLSTWVCLTSGYFPTERCLEGTRKEKFCASREQVQSELELCGPGEFAPMEKYCGKKE
jgi:hypothetical protein